MPNATPDPSARRRRARCAVAGLLLAPLLASCALLGDDDEPAGPGSSYTPPPDVVAGLERALGARARAVTGADRRAFERGLGRDAGLRREQLTWFANLRQLPVGELRYTFDPADLVRDGDDYWVVVEEHLRLDGYDAVPVVRPDRFRFRARPNRPERLVLTSVTDEAWERENDVRPQPWDLGPVEVRSGAGVLGVFDAASLPASGTLLRSVERGIDEVSAVVPYDWSRTVVLYALSDPAFLGTIDDVPGGDPDELDGVAFPVAAAPGEEELAATRFALHPRMLDKPGAARDRLVRHELTHVVLGPRDDTVPVWLSEGIAEYVSVSPLPPAVRVVPAAAVAAAEAGFDQLPADGTFNGDASDEHYALAWWACEYLARSYDETVLWTLLDEMGAPGADPDRLLRDRLGLRPGALAEKAGRLIVTTFGERPPAPPTPIPTPSEMPPLTPVPSPSQTDGAGETPAPSAGR